LIASLIVSVVVAGPAVVAMPAPPAASSIDSSATYHSDRASE
jgi:hypothetical protein